MGRFDHPPHEAHHDPEREVAGGWAIAFVRAGAFEVVLEGSRHRLVEGSVFLTHPGLEFRCGHDGPCPDDVCLTVAFEPEAIAGAEPHQYVVRLRLAAAAELLDQGRGVSDSCWRSGFENLSHFCRAFQGAMGIRASRWHGLPLRERRRKVQALRSRLA